MARLARPRPSGKVHAVRIDDDLAEAIYAKCGGRDHFAEWCRALFRREISEPGAAEDASSTREGWRAGWTQANQTFKSALRNALDGLEKD